MLTLSIRSLLLSGLGSPFLRLSCQRRRRGRYVAHGALRVRCPRCDYMACMFFGGLRTRMPAVGSVLLSVLSFLVLPFLFSFVFCSSLSSPFFLPLSASASGKPDTLTTGIWGGHLVYHASSGLDSAFLIHSWESSSRKGSLGYML